MKINKKLELQEIVITVTAKNLNPAVLNPDFLKYAGIIPIDWELARQPIYTNQAAQLTFQNGISIIVQQNRILFVESMVNKDTEELKVANIAMGYTEKLSQIEYQGVAINLVGYVGFDSDIESHQYLSQTLLSPGSWQDFGETPMRAAIDLSYDLNRCLLNLKINQAILKFPEKSVSAILFSGNFNYQVLASDQEVKVTDLQQTIQNWEADLKTYQQLIEDKFLSSVPAMSNIFPVASLAC